MQTPEKTPNFIDISPTLSEKLGVFPWDVAFKRSVSLDFAANDLLALSSIQTTLHLGAHADGPNHYHPKGVGIDRRPLSLYIGRCLVITANAPRGAPIELTHLASKYLQAESWTCQRVLFRTGSFPDPNVWNSDFNSIHHELVGFLAKAGVKLIGIDTPSIDAETSKELLAHKAVFAADLAILEGLDLSNVADGEYYLVACPLKIQDADASPVRAVLFKDLQLLDQRI